MMVVYFLTMIYMNDIKIPQELENFLKDKKELEYDFLSSEPWKIALKAYEELKIEEIWVDSEWSPIYNEDPNKDKRWYYSIPAISLVGSCEYYEPDFILLWLPSEKLFWTWDCDHWDLRVFLNTSWSDIVKNPLPYINSQWDYNTKVATYFKPFSYNFIEWNPF